MSVRMILTLFAGLVASVACNPPGTETESGVVAVEVVPTDTVPQPAGLKGEQLFVACQACHSIAAGAAHRVGPNLSGIMGQPAASRPGYTYSEALLNSGITWTPQTLMAWIVDPEALVPGTWMAYANIIEAGELETLVGYIVSSSAVTESADNP